MPSSRGSSQPGIKPRSPTLQMDSLLSEPPGKPVDFFSTKGFIPLVGSWVGNGAERQKEALEKGDMVPG